MRSLAAIILLVSVAAGGPAWPCEQRCITEARSQAERLPKPVIDETRNTIAVPWSLSGGESAIPSPHRISRTDDPAWDLIDSLAVHQRLGLSEYLAVQYDSVADSLFAIAPSSALSSLAQSAVDRAPTWLQTELSESFSRMSAGLQDSMARVILFADDPYVDEIAWSIAHISTSDLTDPDFYASLIRENAELLYEVDADVDYAEIVDYGDAATGGDYYSTVRYKVDESGVINEYEYDRDIYYWFIVHPRGSDELPTYIDPDAACSSSGTPAAPPDGRFWREAFYYGMPTHFGGCDNDHNGSIDGPCPVLRDLLMDVHVLWEMEVDVVGAGNGALGQASDWVHRTLGRWGDADGCRPIQPVTIAYWQDGNCGEYQDMQTAAGRTALIPIISVSAHANDHVWNEFYERRWIEWQAEDEQVDHPWGHDGWAGGLAALHTWRGDGHGWTDSTAHYSPTCELVVTITDANGYPVDGARVDVASEPYNILCDSHDFVYQIARGHTDDQGQVSFTLGDNNAEPDACRMYYVRVHTPWADYPSSGYVLVIDHPQPDTTYYWSHQFTEGSVPRLSISTASDPPDPTVDNLLEVTYSVTDEYAFGDGYITGIDYRDAMQPGNVDFFFADDADYGMFTADLPFEANGIAIDSPSAETALVPPAAGDWYAVWSNEAGVDFDQVVDATISLYSNNGYVPPVCFLSSAKGDPAEAVLDWEDPSGINVDGYNVYRSTAAADVGTDRDQSQLAPFLVTTVAASTHSDSDALPSGQLFFFSIRTLGRSGVIADECSY